MAGENLVTVFRSADPDAEEQANVVVEMLRDAGLQAEMFDDREPGVPEGAFEIRVPETEREDAEEILDTQKDFSPVPLDISHDLDMVPVFVSDAHNAEMLALEVRSVLEAHGIPSVLVSAGPFPNLPFEVRVPKTQLEEARRALASAEDAGPSAAEEAERESEGSGGSESGT